MCIAELGDCCIRSNLWGAFSSIRIGLSPRRWFPGMSLFDQAKIVEANNSVFYNVAGNLIFNNYYTGEQNSSPLDLLIVLLIISQIPVTRKCLLRSAPSDGPSISRNVCEEHGPM
jgi:hypothetical protein